MAKLIKVQVFHINHNILNQILIYQLLLCFEQYFDVFITADDVEKHKPDPAPVIAALDQFAVDASEAVFIGDSPHDIAAGRSAGVQTAAVLWGPFTRQALAHQPPDHWLTCPADISTLF